MLYGDAVRIAPAGAAFIEACRQALASLAQQHWRDTPHGVAAASLLRESSWERSAARVHRLIEAVVEKTQPLPQQERHAPEPGRPTSSASRPTQAVTSDRVPLAALGSAAGGCEGLASQAAALQARLNRAELDPLVALQTGPTSSLTTLKGIHGQDQ